MIPAARGHVVTHRSALLAALAAAGVGCTTTQVTTRWKEPSFAGPAVKKVMVMGLSRQAATRRVFENTFAGVLGQEGVEAVASHTVLPQDGPIERDLVVKAVRDAGVDGIIVSRRLVARERSVQRIDQLKMVPMRTLHPGLGHAWVRVYEPREIEIVRAVAETSVYRAGDGMLLWSALTDSADPTHWESATRGFASVGVGAMKKDGIL